jgi:hypothetical protein
MKLRGVLIGVLAVAVVGTTLAVAANPTSNRTITACVKRSTKKMRLASSSNRCKKGERKLSWSQRGPSGAAGTPGTPGTPGQDGAAGADASNTSKATVAAEATTSSTTHVALGGPEVTVDVPTGGANVILGATYDSKNANGSNSSCASVDDGDALLSGMGCFQSSAYGRRRAVFTTTADAGAHTYTLRYGSPSGTAASFQNRTLIVSVLK